jgi:hypothetical protein
LFFQKYQSKIKGLAFGFIPASCNESVWFMQYDVKLASGDEGKALKRFKNFAMTCLPISDVRDVLDANDFSTLHMEN